MTRQSKGFSLTELLVALSVTLVLVAMMFHLFHQNERVLRDQTLIMEMQQTARIVASQIADEIRMAGQGVPIYATSFDASPSEAIAVILGSSSASRIDFRAGLSNSESTTLGGGPINFDIGVSRNVSVAGTSGFSTGKFDLDLASRRDSILEFDIIDRDTPQHRNNNYSRSIRSPTDHLSRRSRFHLSQRRERSTRNCKRHERPCQSPLVAGKRNRKILHRFGFHLLRCVWKRGAAHIFGKSFGDCARRYPIDRRSRTLFE
jgi:prepilin-type N-terminal cleavage/methylation domain-containing protein